MLKIQDTRAVIFVDKVKNNRYGRNGTFQIQHKINNFLQTNIKHQIFTSRLKKELYPVRLQRKKDSAPYSSENL